MSEQTKLLHIPLKNIRENPVALRPVDKTTSEYKELVDSIRAVGIINPISVREIQNPDPAGEQLYSVCDGLHRFTAACDGGLDTIPCQVVTKDDAQVEEAQIIANIHKIETKPAQYSKQLNRMVLRNPDLTLNEISGRLSRSITWLSERLSIVKLKESIQKLVDAGQIVASNAIALAKLPVEMQDDFVERAMTQSPGDFGPAVQAAVKAHRDALRAGKDPNAQPQFIAVQTLRKLSEIKEVLENAKPLAAELIALVQPQTPEEIFALAIKWVMKADPKSVQVQRAKWDAEQADKAAKKRKAELEREEKRKAALAAATAPVTVG